MGFFSNLFKPPLEVELERKFIPLIIREGVSNQQAKETFQCLLKKVKTDIKTGVPMIPNMGDYFLANEQDETVQRILQQRRAVGVTDDDIRAWWNLEQLERGMVQEWCDFQQNTLCEYFKETEGLSQPDAFAKVKLMLPIYGGSIFPEDYLPYELKWKVDAYLLEIANDTENIQRYKDEIAAAGSINVFVKKKLGI